MKTNILDYMDEAAERFPERIAFADDEVSLSFEAFAVRARRVGSMLLAAGAGTREADGQAGSGEPVIIFMKRSPYTLTAFFGTVAAGCYYVPIDVEMPRRRIELILETTQARFMLVDGTTEETAAELAVT